jgi:hypothetical protein
MYARQLSRTLCLVAAGVLAPAALAQFQPTTFFKVTGTAGNALGASARGTGDVNKDGYQDIAVGAPEEGGVGAVKVFSGKDGSLIWKFDGQAAGDRFGYAVSGAGDLDGDGFDDILVGAPQTHTGIGYVQTFSGKTGQVLLTVNGKNFKDLYGFSVSAINDIDNDLIPDILVGAPSSLVSEKGYVQVVSGATGALIDTLHGDAVGDQFGSSVRNAGLVDGDSCPDFIVGAPGANSLTGYARVYSGCTRGSIYTFTGKQANDFFGLSVSGTGDVNGDGQDDVIVGAPGDDTLLADSGSATVYSGKTGLELCTEHGKAPGAILGASVSGAGDVNNDGFADFIVGAPFFCGSPTDAGYARVLKLSGSNAVPIYEMTGDDVGSAFGFAVSEGGDVNQDGLDDFLVLAPCDDSAGPLSGSFRLFSGRVCNASWNNYGVGFPGTNGVPTLTASAAPVICVTINLDVSNSLGADTPAAFLLGLTPGNFPNPSGGTVLVSPPWVVRPFKLPAAGISIPFEVLCDTAFCGLAVYMQVLELDPGAGGPKQDVSTTPGLTLVLGGF